MFRFIKKCLIVFVIIMIIHLLFNKIFAMSHYENPTFKTGIVTASALNVRCGPGTNYQKVGVVYKNEYVRIFAKIGDWYVIQTNSDLIGSVSKNYIRNATVTNNTTSNSNDMVATNDDLSGYSAEEKEVLNLINAQRRNYGLSELSFDAELQRVAKAKVKDMVERNYFDHTSPTYGTPFEMMQAFGITYKIAGENLAGNSSASAAVSAWMNSEGHRANILNGQYNLTGIGVVSSSVYGKVYVQMFIGK